MLNRITCSYPSSEANKTLYLGRLSEVRIAAFDADDGPHEDGAHLDILGLFAALPSLRRLFRSSRCCDGSCFRSFNGNYSAQATCVIEVDIHRSRMFVGLMPRLVSQTQDLQKFNYHLEGRGRDGSGYHDPQPRNIILALQKYARHSLEFLHLTGTFTESLHRDDDTAHCDLRTFKKLRDIVVDYTLFEDNETPCSCEGCLCRCYPSRRLVDILPASIETVKLVGELSTERALATLDGLAELKAERLPNLRTIMMYSALMEKKVIGGRYKAAGVALVESDTKREEFQEITRPRRGLCG